jgi:hypothetical protein
MMRKKEEEEVGKSVKTLMYKQTEDGRWGEI